MNPTVSIVMPVYNGAAFVAEAVGSMLGQTFSDFEFIVVDDASTDGSVEIVNSFKDERIVLLRNESNRGVAASLNIGLTAARGEYVARMDADDISRPDRLAKQVAYLAGNRGVGVCGSWVCCFGAGRSYLLTHPTGADCVRAFLLLGNPLSHSSVCIRASLTKDCGLRYDETIAAAQDYEFWTRCAGRMDVDNIAEPLLRYRVHKASVSRQREKISDGHATSVVAGQLKRFEVEISAQEIAFHRRIGHGGGMGSRSELLAAEQWLERLLVLNRQKSVWPELGLEKAIGFAWFRVCHNSAGLGPWAFRQYYRSGLARSSCPLLREKLVFGLNVLKGWALGGEPMGNLETWDKQNSVKDA